MPDSDVFEFECPRCLKKIRVEQSKAGTRIECPGCEGNLLVPTKSEAKDLFEDIFDSEPEQAAPVPTSKSADKSSAPLEIPDLTIEEGLAAGISPTPTVENSLEPVEEIDDLVAGLEVSEAPPLPLDNVAEPVENDHDAPIRVAGLEGLYDHDDVYGVKCKVCDTHIHVRPEQVGSDVECPECFSKVRVTVSKKTSKQKWIKEGRGRHIKREEKENEPEEIKLSPAVEVPDTGYAVAEPLEDATEGLDVVPDEDLLVAKPHDPADGLVLDDSPDPLAADGIPDLDLVDESAAPVALPRSPKLTKAKKKEKQAPDAPAEQPTKSRVKKPKSRRELYEESQRRIKSGQEQPAFEVELGDTKREGSNYPVFQLNKITDVLSDAFAMVFTAGVIWRTLIAVAFLLFGTIAVQVINYAPPADPNVQVEVTGEPDGTFLESLKVWTKSGILGGIPYLIGLLGLWHVCSYVFREAALGQRKVEDWYKGGVNEVLGTTLLFGFSFFLAGLPALIYPPLVTPLRIFFAPLLLLGAWYNQAPFNIVSVDAYKRVTKQMGQWTTFYAIMAGLAFFALIAGFMFEARDHAISSPIIGGFFAVCSILVLVVISLIFAAITGWHCGRVVEELENPDKPSKD